MDARARDPNDSSARALAAANACGHDGCAPSRQRARLLPDACFDAEPQSSLEPLGASPDDGFFARGFSRCRSIFSRLGALARALPHAHSHAHTHARPRGHSHARAAGHSHGPLGDAPPFAGPSDNAAQTRGAQAARAGAPTCGHFHLPHLPAAGQERAFALAVGLNLAIVAIQGVCGALAHSTALLADAGHNLFDALGLLLAWGAVYLSQKSPSRRYTFGLGASSILASLLNAGLLIAACAGIAWESIARLSHPQPVAGGMVFAVALLGLLANGFCAMLFMRGARGKHADLNLRGAFLHMLSDAAVSAAVAVSGLGILWTGWNWLDPVLSLAVVAAIAWSAWGLVAESVRLALGAVPSRVDVEGVERYLSALPGVKGVHDLHVWGLSTTQCALSAHLVMPAGHPGDAFFDGAAQGLLDRCGIQHATLQICLGSRDHCSLSPAR